MKKELEATLVGLYPNILREYGGDRKKTCMHWGMQHQDGWYNILNDTLSQLDYFCRVAGCDVVAQEIKEKFGELLFYYKVETGNETDKKIIRFVIQALQDKSVKTCEITGTEGVRCIKYEGVYQTLSREKAKELGFHPCSIKDQDYWNYLDMMEKE
jgi:hypothetical protein